MLWDTNLPPVWSNKGNSKNRARKQVKPKSNNSGRHNEVNNHDLDTSFSKHEETEAQKKSKANKEALLLGDTHVRRLNPDKLTNIIPAGIGGLKSDEILRRHSKVINENIGDVDEVIIHIGTNDLSTKSPKAIVHHVDNALQSIKSKNPDVNMAVSSVFLQKKNTSLNIKAIDT